MVGAGDPAGVCLKAYQSASEAAAAGNDACVYTVC